MVRTITTKGGQVLTESDLDALVDEFERGVDLSKWHFRRGRPYLSQDAVEHSPRIAVRLPADLHRRVHEKAGSEGRSVSKVVRALLEEYAGESRTLR